MIQWNPDTTICQGTVKLYRCIETLDITIWPQNNRKYRYIGVKEVKDSETKRSIYSDKEDKEDKVYKEA